MAGKLPKGNPMPWIPKYPHRKIIFIAFSMRIYWDALGWTLLMQTPLLGVQFSRNYLSVNRCGRETSLWLGFITRIPMEEGGLIYIWSLRKEWKFLPLSFEDA